MRRKAKCKECGSEVFDYAQNDKTGKPEWECQNCFARSPRQVRKSAKQRKVDKMFKGVFEATDPAMYTTKQKANVGLFLGRMQPIHFGHEKIIKQLRKFNKPVIAIVKGKESSKDKSRNPLSFAYQKELIKKLFPSAIVIETKTGYIPDIVNDIRKKYKGEVVSVYSGEDRISGYKKQIDSFNKQMPDEKKINTKFVQTGRYTSATTVRNSVKQNDLKTFKKNMPKKLHGEWEKMRGLIK